MKENIENNTESKFGSFLNFMKKFLAMSFFCAMAAFGFGALNTQAVIDSKVAQNYTDVENKDNPGKKISEYDPKDTSTLKHYTEKDGVLYYANNTGATAYALKRSSAGQHDLTTELTVSTGTEIEYDTDQKTKVNKIDTQLIKDGVQNLTINGYTNTAGTGNIKVEGSSDNGKLKTLMAVDSAGKSVATAKSDTELLKLVNSADDINPVVHKLALSTTEVIVNSNKVWSDTELKTEVKNQVTVNKTDDGSNVDGDWSWVKASTDGNEFEATFTPTNTSISPETFKIKISGRTPAAAEITKEKNPVIEYEAGQTTWNEFLTKAKVNTSKDKGATGYWTIKADNVSGTIINYGSGTEYLGKVKMEAGLKDATLTYKHGSDDAFSDSVDAIVISLKDITEDLDTEKFGKQKTFGDYSFYVNDKTGETSVIVSQEEGKIAWAREESYGTEAWYGFDNSEGALPDGSVVSVRWLNKNDGQEYYEMLEKASQGLKSLGIVAEDEKVWIFDLNAYKKVEKDGKVTWDKIEDFKNKTVKVYIELGDDWDMNDISAIYVDDNNKVTTWDKTIEVKEINGVYKRFAVLNLKHFSAHIVYDEKKAIDIIEKLNQVGEDAKAEYLKNNPNAKPEELNKIAEDAVTKAYNELSEEDREQIEEYMKRLLGQGDAAPTPSDNKTTPEDNAAPAADKSSSGSSSKSSSSSSSSSSKVKTGKDETLLALLLLLSSGGALSLNLAMRKKYFNI
ncbi:MAG: hypothetical protein J6P21_01285 [Clostridia bacterium]|nr:hypothetical protein [Clostridia bacterium]